MRQKYIVASQNIPFPFLCLFDYKFQCDRNKLRASHSCHSLTTSPVGSRAMCATPGRQHLEWAYIGLSLSSPCELCQPTALSPAFSTSFLNPHLFLRAQLNYQAVQKPLPPQSQTPSSLFCTQQHMSCLCFTAVALDWAPGSQLPSSSLDAGSYLGCSFLGPTRSVRQCVLSWRCGWGMRWPVLPAVLQ